MAQDDNISPFSTYSKYFNASDTKTDTVTIYWYWDGNVDDENDNSFIGKTISANIVINSKQTNPAYMKNGYNGKTEFWNDTYKPYVRTITFDNNLSNLPSSCTEDNLCWDISYSSTQKKKVYGYLIDSGLTIEETDSSTSTTVNRTLYNLYIVSEAQIFAPSNCGQLFGSFEKLIQINFNNNFNTSNVTSMNSMFYSCKSLTNLDLSNFNTSNVTKMNYMFHFCSSLTSLDLNNFNTSNVTSMDSMFYSCRLLTTLDLSNFNTSNVTSMSSMFEGCSSLINLDISSFNTSNVTNMFHMFYSCAKLQAEITIIGTNIINYSGMFNYALSDVNAYVIINYSSEAESIAQGMRSTALNGNESKITLKQI